MAAPTTKSSPENRGYITLGILRYYSPVLTYQKVIFVLSQMRIIQTKTDRMY